MKTKHRNCQEAKQVGNDKVWAVSKFSNPLPCLMSSCKHSVVKPMLVTCAFIALLGNQDVYECINDVEICNMCAQCAGIADRCKLYCMREWKTPSCKLWPYMRGWCNNWFNRSKLAWIVKVTLLCLSICCGIHSKLPDQHGCNVHRLPAGPSAAAWNNACSTGLQAKSLQPQ